MGARILRQLRGGVGARMESGTRQVGPRGPWQRVGTLLEALEGVRAPGTGPEAPSVAEGQREPEDTDFSGRTGTLWGAGGQREGL